MADTTAADFREQMARIDRAIAETSKLQEETRKFVAESHKLAAEQLKLSAQQEKWAMAAMKAEREHALAPWQIIIGAMTAGATLFGAGVALMKVLGG